MALLGFTLPPDSGEKLTLGIVYTIAIYNILYTTYSRCIQNSWEMQTYIAMAVV
jgi:hypothetical protein